MDSGKDMWSRLCLLAETVVMAAEEEEQRRRLLAEKREDSKSQKKTVSEEDDSEKRFLSHVPRKKRSSLVKRQQKPNGVSTSSSSLPDLNQIPIDYETETKQNPSFIERLVCDEEQRVKKGKSRIIWEEEEEADEDSEKRLFEKNLMKFVRHSQQQQKFETLNGASSSSSFLNLRCYEASLFLDYNTVESEKTETKVIPNPNYQSSSPSSCLTENDTSRKRRAVEQRKSGKVKKLKVSPLPRLSTETPEWVFQAMGHMNADAETPKLIFERTLFKSDVNSNLSRLLIPFEKLIRNDFLTPEECRAMQEDKDKDDEDIGVGTILVCQAKQEDEDKDDEYIGAGTILVNQRFKMWGLRFKIWGMEKDSGHGTLNYILNWDWNDVVKGNSLKAGDNIGLWTFRCRGVLCFALDTW
ncbi:unnamed protein product [Arabidopsis thaliana]|uniref:(thale cress) hypothetical protein n=1 Tax=Arabidopsis thaliana TaxID=3702 RepID=A0A7G2FEB6_ARATH|nr:unnamed protein product [Arabidopsis thaliana]